MIAKVLEIPSSEFMRIPCFIRPVFLQTQAPAKRSEKSAMMR